MGKIFVDSDEAQKSISKTGENAEGLGKKLTNGIGTAAKWAAGITGAAVAVGGAMVAAAKGTAEAADTIDKASQRMKIDAETYQELAYAANLSGVEMSTLEQAAKKLEGTDINFDDAINEIMSLSDETERSAKAAEFFGESVAYKMTPLLNAGADGLEAMKQEARALGVVMSEDSVKSGAEMNDMFSKVEASISMLKNNLVAEFMPYVQDIFAWLIENMPTILDTVKGVMDAIMPIVKPILDAVMALLPPLLNAIKGFVDWILPYIIPVVDDIKVFVDGVISLFKGDFEGFSSAIKKVFTDLGSAMYDIGKNILNSLWNGIKEIWEKISAWVMQKVGWFESKFSGVVDFLSVGGVEFGGGGFGGSGGHGGSFATGLPFVPYDGFQATLHRGETVINSTDASQLLDRMTQIAEAGAGAEQTISLNVQLDGVTLAQQLYRYTRDEQMRQGGSLAFA